MATMIEIKELREVSPEPVAHDGPPEWTGYTAEIGGNATTVFEVFAATRDVSPPFRTLIWRARVPRDTRMGKLSEEFFRCALADPSFSVVATSHASEFDVVARTLDSAKTKHRAVIESLNWIEELTAETTRFFRIDYHSLNGVLGLCYRQIAHREEYELAVMMQRGLNFRAELFRWIFKYHVEQQLGDDARTGFSELAAGLNAKWASTVRLGAAN
jgi:hypothetical protein